MNCHDLDLLLERHRDKQLPEAAEQHLATCEACRQLMAAWRTARTRSLSKPDERSNLPRFELPSELEPVRPAPRGVLLVLPALIAVTSVCAIGIIWWGLAGWQAQTALERTFLFGAIVAALFASTYSLSLQMIPGSKPRFNWRAMAGGASLTFLCTVLIAFHHVYRFNLSPMHGECFGRSLLIAAGLLPLLVLSVKRGVFLDFKKACATVAATIASAALLVATVYCPILTWQHVVIGHLGATCAIFWAGLMAGAVRR
jgi:hypothetical protein